MQKLVSRYFNNSKKEENKKMLIDKIRQDMMDARKSGEKDKAVILSVLITEADKIGKDDGNRQTTDEEVIRIAKKMVAGNSEMIKISNDTDRDPSQYEDENVVFNQYLPKQMTEEKLRFTISEFVALIDPDERKKAMGTVMKYLKEEFTGLYDGKMASKIVKEELFKEL